MSCFGPSGGPVAAINSMKEMVKEFHANGIEVLLEVVFTHTAKGEVLQGIDKSSYYRASKADDLEARNSLNCNHPVVQQMVLDSLRYWVTEFHVDGFCFINASSLLCGVDGEYQSHPPLVEAIAFDPVLTKTKFIADRWDPHEMVLKETCFPHWKRWAEVNTRFCNDVRNFLRGEGLLSDLATRLCGNGDIFSDGRGPAFSFNFISRNSGLPLVDLVSFSGSELSSELSWNCGEEGPTSKTAVLERRLKQIRNFLFILFLSLGVPVLNMGDECGQSSGGSPAYRDRKSFDWKALETGFATQTTQFISYLSSLRRRRSDLLQKQHFFKEENIDWFGSDQSSPRWEDPLCKFLAVRLKADQVEAENQSNNEYADLRGDLFVAFSAANQLETVILPPLPEGMAWSRLVDTALPFPGFFSISGEPVIEEMESLIAYEMKSHSCALFEARSL
ncbi:isoamylase 2, chloroplastic [Argentina anserina]|uniref:isoamylase 2, chloroplastic n=1 Tax=Argentina anserina TaxID=57926 RepID=UPI0021763A63|nr:isoamylase 2, chloroplastic [Potentilla anserina]